MSDAVLLLNLEHANQAKLLDVIDDKLRRLAGGEAIDLDLVVSILDYFRSFGGTCHHPKEDLIYRALRRRDPEAAASIGALIEEHEELARMTSDLADLIMAARADAEVPAVRLIGALQHFRDFYWRHMEMEEKHFFPAALRVLSDDDWKAIDFDLFDREDPLFSDEVEERFDKLRGRLIAQAR